MDIGGFQVKINDVALFDFAKVKAFDSKNEKFYENPAFEGASVLGVIDMTLTNGAG